MDREILKNLAIELANEQGLINLTREGLAQRAGIPAGSLQWHTGCKFSELVDEITPYVRDVPHGRPTIRTRTTPRLRRSQLLTIAADLAAENGLGEVTTRAVADRAEVSVSLVKQYLGGAKALQGAILKHAVESENLAVLAQGLILNHPDAIAAPPELQKQALDRSISE